MKEQLSQKDFIKAIKTLWPIAKGSLAQVRKPCIRPNCKACKDGRKHAAYIFAFTKNGKRHCMYVPKDLAPVMKKAIANGRRLEKIMSELGPALIKNFRENR